MANDSREEVSSSFETVDENDLGTTKKSMKDIDLGVSGDNHFDPNSTLKLWISGIMATVLWTGTGVVIGCHLYSIIDLGYKLSQVKTGTPNSKEEVANFQISISAVDGTAKGLYSFLTPFAAAVTGFYFNEASANRQKEK